MNFVRFSSNGKALVGGLLDGNLLTWDLEQKKLIFNISEKESVWSIGFSRTGVFFACRVEGNLIKVWKVGC